MDYLNEPSYMSKVCDLGKESPLPPKSPFQCMVPNHSEHFVKSAIGSQRISKPTGEQQQQQRGQHHRTSSDSLLIEEQPFWLDDLLTEPETPPGPPHPKGHRRSSSDPVAYLDSATNAIAYENILYGGPSSMLYGNNHYENHMWHPSSGSNHCVANKQQNGAWEASLRTSFEKVGSNNLQKQMQEGKDGFSLNNDSSQGVPAFRNDSKRAKQQIAHRSRLRRLQYIAELERSVQMLQGEGSEVSAELEYLDHQVLILSMENRALKQRLDSLSQVHHLKHMEQDMLEREVGRLQFIYHQQQQQQLQPQQQQQKHSTRRQPKNKELVNQFPKLTL